MLNILALGCMTILMQSQQQILLKDGDMVAFVGATMIELEQIEGYWETEITRRTPSLKIRFRNLGWSGDTVQGHSRAGFGSVADGYKKLQENIKAVSPTVTLFAYGQNESFDSDDGLGAFRSGFERLLTESTAYRGRSMLLTPWQQEKLSGPFPDPSKHNQDLEKYSNQIREMAASFQCPVLDLYSISKTNFAKDKLLYTDNTLHFTGMGYLRSSRELARGFQLPKDEWLLELNLVDGSLKTGGCKVEKAGAMAWKVQDAMLPAPLDPKNTEGTRKVVASGLKQGNYLLKIDGKEVARGSAQDWAKGIAIPSSPDYFQVEALRKKIQEKNRQFFHRWRPQNETYLFGFRKHEQGQNAREIPQFDPIVASHEEEISKLKQPVQRTYEWSEIQ